MPGEDDRFPIDDPVFPPGPAKPFKVYRTDVNDAPYELEAAYATPEEALNHPWKPDRRYRIAAPGRKYLSRNDFEDWAKSLKK